MQTAGSGETLEQRCGHCGRVNRVDAARVESHPICGACKRPLFASGPLEVSDATFAEEVERSPVPVLVDFWAPWCGPCRRVAPVIDQIAAERSGQLKVVKVNVDECPRTAARFSVQAIPTFGLFRDGQLVDELRGAVGKPALDARIARVVGHLRS